MTTALAKYDALCRALAEARAVDEVKQIRDVSVAMAAYARQAKNKDMEADAAAIRMRSTRRLGEMMAERKRTVGLNPGARFSGGLKNNPPQNLPTLASQGIDKNLAQEARTLGAMAADAFEERVDTVRDEVRGVVSKAARAQARKAAKHDREQPYGKPSDHANAPYELRQKAKQQRSRAAALSRMAPHTLEGWRAGYLFAVRKLAPDVAAEHEIIWEEFKEMMGERDKQRQAAE